MLRLHDWQQSFQTAVLSDVIAEPLLAAIRRQGVIPQQRIGIYRTAYSQRLTEALHSNFPGLALYLGEERFNDMAQAFIADQPSRHPSIRWFGAGLAAFLHQYQDPVLHEFAAFEWALRHTVDAADQPVLATQTLLALPVEDWLTLSLELQPAVTLLSLEWNVPVLWKALMDQGAAPEPQQVPQHWLIYRRPDLMSMWRSLEPQEAELLALTSQGLTFEGLCEAIAEHADQADDIPIRAASLLRTWVEEGLLIDNTQDS